MLPVKDDIRKLVLDALKNEAAQLAIEKGIPQADKSDLMSDDDYAALIAQYDDLHRRLLDNELILFDAAPRCMVTIKGKGQCEGAGQYAPFIVVYGDDKVTPVCQAETTPPLRVCKEHATNNVDHYLPPENWKDISAQAVRATGQLVRRENARVMFLDTESGQMVPPPSISIAKAH